MHNGKNANDSEYDEEECLDAKLTCVEEKFALPWMKHEEVRDKEDLEDGGDMAVFKSLEEAEKLDAEVARRNAAAKKEANKRKVQLEDDSRAAKRTKQTE